MGLLDILRRFSSSTLRIDFYKYKHGDCANYNNGTCRVAHFTNLKPGETACPHFKAKQTASTNS
jgi:hypothetical protein